MVVAPPRRTEEGPTGDGSMRKVIIIVKENFAVR